jgi:zinc protease
LSLWYNQWYSPNNAILVLVGDINSANAKKLVSQAFHSVKAQQLSKPTFQKQPPPVGSKSVRVNAPAKLPWLAMAYQTPVYKTVDDKKQAYALKVLQAALTMGRDSLLQRQLVRQQQLAVQISSHYSLWRRLNGSFAIEATPANGVNASRVRRAILNELEQLRRKPMEQSQLQRAKRQLIAQNTFQKDSLFYQAYELGRLRVVGLPAELIDQWSQGIKSVTAKQVQKTAQLFFNSKRLTSARLIPETINNQPETE